MGDVTRRQGRGTVTEVIASVDVTLLRALGDVAHGTICPLLACQSRASHFATAFYCACFQDYLLSLEILSLERVSQNKIVTKTKYTHINAADRAMTDRRRRQQRNPGNNDPSEDGRAAVRERSRAVAEREASRLARPDRPAAARILGPASGAQKSSTPFGAMFGGRDRGTTSTPVEEEWCGPFSVARQMIAAREEARRLREEQQAEEDPERGKESHPLDQATEIALERKRRLENPSLNWVSRRQRTEDGSRSTSYYAQRRTRVHRQKSLMGNGSNYVPSLFQLCVNYLVDNFEHIETLGLVDHSIRRALCERLVAQGKMDGGKMQHLRYANANLAAQHLTRYFFLDTSKRLSAHWLK